MLVEASQRLASDALSIWRIGLPSRFCSKNIGRCYLCAFTVARFGSFFSVTGLSFARQFAAREASVLIVLLMTLAGDSVPAFSAVSLVFGLLHGTQHNMYTMMSQFTFETAMDLWQGCQDS